MDNYFSYFTEIEERYLHRRKGGLLLSTLDWALIETWKDAGVPLEAALHGIDSAFDRYDQRSSKTRKINSLAFCSQEVLAAAEDMKDAAAGSGKVPKSGASQGFEPEAIASFLCRNADSLEAANLPAGSGISPHSVAAEAARTLRQLAEEISMRPVAHLENLERRLTAVEEKLFAALTASTADVEIVEIRAAADRELASYRRKMSGPQIEQLLKQYTHRRLLEKYRLPRLSLFYM